MASRTAGYGPQCTMSDNGAGKVRVTFPVYDFDWYLYSLIAVDGSHYLYNQSTVVSGAITAKGGTESGGYYFDIGGTVYPSANWANTNRCVPTFQAAANDYNTITLLNAALVTNDTGIIWYATTTLREMFFAQVIGGAAKGVNALGGLSRQRVTLLAGNMSIISASGDVSTISPRLMWSNFTISGGGFTVSWQPDALKSGLGVTIDRIVVIGTNQTAFICWSTAAAGSFTCQNCASIFGQYNVGFYVAWGGTATGSFYFCTAIGHEGVGCYNGNTASTWTSCASLWNTEDYNTKTNGIYTSCASTDATGTAGLINLTRAQLALWRDNDNKFYTPQFRILTTSALYHTGTAVGGITTDIDGTTRANPPSIGAHEGTAYAYSMVPFSGIVVPAVGHVRAPDKYGQVTGQEYTGTETLPDVALVNSGSQYGAGGTEFTGTLAFTIPTAPTWNGLPTSGNGQVTLPVVPAMETDVVYAVYKPVLTGSWSAQSETFKRTGSGNIVVTGLSNGTAYWFAIYSKRSGAYSAWTGAVPCVPSDPAAVTSHLKNLKVMVTARIAALLTSYSITAYDAVTPADVHGNHAVIDLITSHTPGQRYASGYTVDLTIKLYTRPDRSNDNIDDMIDALVEGLHAHSEFSDTYGWHWQSTQFILRNSDIVMDSKTRCGIVEFQLSAKEI